jgi:hypothetical protein
MAKRGEPDNCEELIDIRDDDRYISDDEFALNRLDIDDIDDSQDDKDNQHYIIDAVDSKPRGDSIILYDRYKKYLIEKKVSFEPKKKKRRLTVDEDDENNKISKHLLQKDTDTKDDDENVKIPGHPLQKDTNTKNDIYTEFAGHFLEMDIDVRDDDSGDDDDNFKYNKKNKHSIDMINNKEEILLENTKSNNSAEKLSTGNQPTAFLLDDDKSVNNNSSDTENNNVKKDRPKKKQRLINDEDETENSEHLLRDNDNNKEIPTNNYLVSDDDSYSDTDNEDDSDNDNDSNDDNDSKDDYNIEISDHLLQDDNNIEIPKDKPIIEEDIIMTEGRKEPSIFDDIDSDDEEGEILPNIDKEELYQKFKETSKSIIGNIVNFKKRHIRIRYKKISRRYRKSDILLLKSPTGSGKTRYYKRLLKRRLVLNGENQHIVILCTRQVFADWICPYFKKSGIGVGNYQDYTLIFNL